MDEHRFFKLIPGFFDYGFDHFTGSGFFMGPDGVKIAFDIKLGQHASIPDFIIGKKASLFIKPADGQKKGLENFLEDYRCTGDPAKQMGNEFLFAGIARQNIEEFSELGIKKNHYPLPALL